MESSVCIPDGTNLNSQYSIVTDAEKYSNTFQNCNINMHRTNSPLMGAKLNSPGYFDSEHQKPCVVLGSQTQLTSNPQEILNSHIQDRSLISPVRYVHTASHYMGMTDYADTTDPSIPLDTQYMEEPAIAYGYLTDGNYRLPSESNTYSSRPILFSENYATSETAMLSNPNPHAEFASDKHAPQMRDTENDIIEGLRKDMLSTMRWRDPNLSEVISFLNNPSNTVKANAAAYLQHLCYMDDPNKQRTRTLGGIPPLVCLLSYDAPEIHKNACGALRNLSYGRQNDENKRAVKNAGGITALVSLLCRTQESEVKELVTGVLWNLSSCEDIKRSIIDESLTAVVRNIIKPHSGWDEVCPGETCYSTVFRNASGVVRNISSAGEYARIRLRNEEFLVDCLLYVIKQSIEKNNMGNKTVENCVCILRNLSYRCQEVEDPFYDKQPTVTSNRATTSSSRGENLGCFGTTKKKKNSTTEEQQDVNSYAGAYDKNAAAKNISHKRYERLWQPEIVQYYLVLLQSCSNPETLEAAAGALQNLSACYWQPSIDIRATVRKEKGLPILVELLRMEVDRVVCAVATALRNLAIDQRNKELIGKYAMRDLVQKLPSGNAQHDMNTSDDTITAVLATINEVIKKNTEFARSLLDSGGVERLMNITRNRQMYTTCVLRFSSQVLFTLWQHSDLREVYKRNGWKESDFITKSFAAFNSSLNSPNNINNTLNRPMASQGRTRYEDRTLQRGSSSAAARSNNCSDQQGDPKDCSMLRPMVDDIAVNGVRDEGYLLSNDSSSLPMYIPIVNGESNNPIN